MPALLPLPIFDRYDSLLYMKEISLQDLINLLTRNERSLVTYLTSLNNQFQDSVESVNAITTVVSNLALTAQDIGFRISGGTNPRTLTVDSNLLASTGLYVAGIDSRIAITGSTTLGAGGQIGLIDISPVYPGQTSITTLGSIHVGTWNAGQVTAPLLRIGNTPSQITVFLDSSGIHFKPDVNNNDVLLFVDKAIRKGNILYSSSDDLLTTLSPNITTARKYLSQIGDGTSPLSTTWETVSGTGDVVGPSVSVDNEIVLFNSTTGKLIKRAVESGFLKGTSGVLSAVTNVVEGDLSLTDITTNNVSTTKHGFTPKLPNDATKYLDGTGGYTVPPSGIAIGGTITSSTTGSVLFIGSSSTLQQNNSNFFWDNSNIGLRIGAASTVGTLTLDTPFSSSLYSQIWQINGHTIAQMSWGGTSSAPVAQLNLLGGASVLSVKGIAGLVSLQVDGAGGSSLPNTGYSNFSGQNDAPIIDLYNQGYALKYSFDWTGTFKGTIGKSTSFMTNIGLVDIQTSSTGIGNAADTTDDTLFTYTLPLNSMWNNGKSLRSIATGHFATNVNLKRVKFWFAGTVIADSGAAGTSNTDWLCSIAVTRIDATHVSCIGKFEGGGLTDSILVTPNLVVSDLTSNNSIVKITGASTVTGAANDVLGYQIRTEFMN